MENKLFNLMKNRYESSEFEKWGITLVSRGLESWEEKIIKEYFIKPGRILDLGCGGGREAIPLAKEGYKVVAIDLSEKLIKVAKQNAKKARVKNIKFKVANVCNLPFDAEEFDYALAFQNLISHVPGRKNRIKALKEIKRVLRPEGLLVAVSNSINAKYFYRFYFGILNLFRKFYNPYKLEPSDIIPFRSRGKFRIFRKGPIFHWYTALEFIEDICQANLRLIEFLSAEEIIKGKSNLRLREKGGPICYIIQK